MYDGDMSNMQNCTFLMVMVACVFAGGALTGQDAKAVAAPGEKVRRLSGGFEFTEGPCADKDGNVYFTDQPVNTIWKWSVTGELSVFLKPSGRANGMNFTADGRLVACADEKNELWLIAADGSREVLAGTWQGKPLNGPNDVFVHPSGGMYLTDPYYQRSWFSHQSAPQAAKGVYYLAPGAKELVLVEDGLVQPNGITGSPDGKILYVSDIDGKKTLAYDIAADGRLANRRLFCAQGSDGMTVDNEGNVYLTGNGVTVYDREGRKIDQIRVREGWTANVCFGGSDRSTLFITASRGLYALKTRVHGVFSPGK